MFPPRRPNTPSTVDEGSGSDPLKPDGSRALAKRVATELLAGRDPGDWTFDRLLPRSLEVVSEQFWTPLAVAIRVADWLDDFDVRTVVDIGSGVGKFCVAAALSGRCTFVGIEHRPRLVRAARQLAHLLGVEHSVRFFCGTFGDDAPPIADAYYLYNPFGENLFGRRSRLDDAVELSDDRYCRDVAALERFLSEAPAGTFVISYNGFGGTFPAGYDQVRVARDLPNVLRMARKVG